MKPNQLEERLIQFAIDVILLCEKIDKSFASEHLANTKYLSKIAQNKLCYFLLF